MTDKSDLTLALTLEQRRGIEELAQRRGYNALDDYLLSLVEGDAETLDELSQEDLIANFR